MSFLRTSIFLYQLIEMSCSFSTTIAITVTFLLTAIFSSILTLVLTLLLVCVYNKRVDLTRKEPAKQNQWNRMCMKRYKLQVLLLQYLLVLTQLMDLLVSTDKLKTDLNITNH